MGPEKGTQHLTKPKKTQNQNCSTKISAIDAEKHEESKNKIKKHQKTPKPKTKIKTEKKRKHKKQNKTNKQKNKTKQNKKKKTTPGGGLRSAGRAPPNWYFIPSIGNRSQRGGGQVHPAKKSSKKHITSTKQHKKQTKKTKTQNN